MNIHESRNIYISYSDDYQCVFNNSKLTVIDYVLYVVSDADTNNIKNILYAPDTSLQEGDGDTEVFLLNNKHLLIYNCGDVESVLFIKND